MGPHRPWVASGLLSFAIRADPGAPPTPPPGTPLAIRRGFVCRGDTLEYDPNISGLRLAMHDGDLKSCSRLSRQRITISLLSASTSRSFDTGMLKRSHRL